MFGKGDFMTSKHFAYIWQYKIQPDLRPEFLAAYCPGGEWTRLFARDPEYIETQLLQDAAASDQYLTIDYWKSQRARDAFRKTCASEFNALDEKCEAFTQSEIFIGDFLILGKRMT